MALIKCPECGKDISDKSSVCIHCGYPIEKFVDENLVNSPEINKIAVQEKDYINDLKQLAVNKTVNDDILSIDNPRKIKSKKSIIKWLIIFIVFLIVFVTLAFFKQNTIKNNREQAKAAQAISYFEAEKYKEALDAKNNLNQEELLNEYASKIILMGNLTEYSENYDNPYTCLLYFVGHYNEFEELGLIDKTQNIVREYAQNIANKNVNIAALFERSIEDKNASQQLEPILSSNKDKMLEVMKNINDSVDYDLAKKEYEKQKKEEEEEAQKAYNDLFPVQVSTKECDVTYNRGYYYCNGTVHNVSSSTHYYVKVKVTYYDNNNTVLTTDWTYVVGSEGIRGGENQQFEIMTKVSGEVDKYSVEILDWD